jgi:hypothetical protein
MLSFLGKLGPQTEGALQGQVGVMRALQEQALDDIILVGRQGADVTVLQQQHDLLANNIISLETEIQSMNEGEVDRWNAQAAEVEAGYRAQLNELAKLRQSTATGLALRGTWWGLGTAAVVAGLAYWIWFAKRRKGRRR